MSKIIQSILTTVVSFGFLTVGLVQNDTVLIALASFMLFGAGNLLGIAICLRSYEDEK